MQLYKIPNHTEVYLTAPTVQVPIVAPPGHEGEVIKYFHVDGMYSYCEDSSGNPLHLLAWQEVELV